MKTIQELTIALLTFAFTLYGMHAHAQDVYASDSSILLVSSGYIQPIAKGKYRTNFTFDYGLAKSPCASIYRESNIDTANMTFDGFFQDKRADGTTIAEGFYKNGYLDSTLIIRYLNGNIWQRGYYKDGKMHGKWEYFFPNGEPMYTLHIKESRLFLDTVWDVDGKVLVNKGKGKAIIYHYSIKSATNEKTFSWRGKVRGGLMQGIWMPFKNDVPIDVKQVYVNGKFINGFDSGEFYNTIDFFSVGQNQSLINAELLEIDECDENPTNDTPPFHPFGEIKLKQELYREIDKLPRPFPNSCIVRVSFNVNEKGELSAFKGESETGIEDPLIEALRKQGPWLPATIGYMPVAQRAEYLLFFVNKHLRDKDVNFQKKQPSQTDPFNEGRNQPRPEIEEKAVQWKKIQ